MSAAMADAPAPATRVLLVEDDPFQRLQMERTLKRAGFPVRAVADVERALAACEDELPELVVTDWQLGERSGIDLCRELRTRELAHRPHIILVTGSESADSIADAIAAGADDFVPKPCNPVELIARCRAGERLFRLQYDLKVRGEELQRALRAQLDSERQRRTDMAVAVTLQQAMLERLTRPPPGLRCAALFEAAADLAGDLHGLLRLDGTRIGFFQIDIEGHGVASAMSSFALASWIQSYELQPEQFDDPAEVVRQLNARLLKHKPLVPSCTVVLGWLDTGSGEGRLCQAGHPHPLLCRPHEVVALGDGGFPVGLLDGMRWDATPFVLAPGEQLVLHSDGLADCINSQHQPLGDDGMLRLLATSAGSPEARLQAVIDGLGQWRRGMRLVDDVSLLVIEPSAFCSFG